MSDLISRHAAMEEISKQQTYKMFEGEDTLYLDANDVGSVLASLPSAEPELIEREAYIRGFEQGKTQGRLDTLSAQPEITRCKECVHADGFYHCDYMATWHDGECFCSYGKKEN